MELRLSRSFRGSREIIENHDVRIMEIKHRESGVQSPKMVKQRVHLMDMEDYQKIFVDIYYSKELSELRAQS